jgi:hypothetical protein
MFRGMAARLPAVMPDLFVMLGFTTSPSERIEIAGPRLAHFSHEGPAA